MSRQTAAILDLRHDLPPTRTSIVHPVKPKVIEAAADAVRKDLIVALLVEPAGKIAAAAHEASVDISGWAIVDTECPVFCKQSHQR